MIRIYTISRVLSMGDTMGCGVVSIRVNRHFSRHGKLGPQEGRELELVYTIRKAPGDNGTLRRGTTSDERKGRPCWRFHCPAWWSNSQENMQINYLQRLTRKLRLGDGNEDGCAGATEDVRSVKRVGGRLRGRDGNASPSNGADIRGNNHIRSAAYHPGQSDLGAG